MRGKRQSEASDWLDVDYSVFFYNCELPVGRIFVDLSADSSSSPLEFPIGVNINVASDVDINPVNTPFRATRDR